MRALSADFWSGLALGGLGAYIIVRASSWEYLGPDGPGPGFFPLWYGIAMAALSLGLMFSSLRKQDPDQIDWSGAGRAFATWFALLACVALLNVAGFLLCLAGLTFFIIAVMYRRPLQVAASAAIALAGAFYLIFPFALGVRLP